MMPNECLACHARNTRDKGWFVPNFYMVGIDLMEEDGAKWNRYKWSCNKCGVINLVEGLNKPQTKITPMALLLGLFTFLIR